MSRCRNRVCLFLTLLKKECKTFSEEESNKSSETSSEISKYNRLKSLMSAEEAIEYENMTKSEDVLDKVAPLIESDEELKKIAR